MAGSVAIELTRVQELYRESGIIEVAIDWVADVAAATVPDTAIPAHLLEHIKGLACVLALTVPGAVTAPTDNYDITLEDAYGVDVMGGVLTDRSATVKQQVVPLVGDVYAGRLCGGAWTFKLANNLVNSATGKCVLYFV